ncbi:T-cell differentiation antigen CD6 isoform X2 [Cavia porcellus]|uniref:T-cell differentiation antigen CD6 isoform X2 n=1 Tax=Cavia porcellus TaxID=10141 RepID=UPI002FE20EAE
MASAMWLFLGLAGWLTAALSGLSLPTTATPGQHNVSIKALKPGFRVRLANRSSSCRGEVEVQLGALWAPACGVPWDYQAAEAVCRALGCGSAELTLEPEPATPVGNASTSNTTRGRALAVHCRGPAWGLCEVKEDACRGDAGPARVICADPPALRLVGGTSPCAGRVEMLERGVWGTVCDDAWDLEDAHVVCRQLGCGWAVEAVPGLRFPAGRGLIHRNTVNCTGDEEHLWDCESQPGDGYCGHKEDAGVVCSEHQSWRLTGGSDRCEGQVEVHFRGVWSTVCDSQWYQPEADVLCRALGCGCMADRPPGQPHSLPGRMFYSCEGDEATPFLCTWRFNNSNLCSQSRAARVICSGSRTLYNLSASPVPSSIQPGTVGSSVPVETEKSRELLLLVPSLVLGILLLGALVTIAVILLRVKGKYALPVARNHQHLLPSATPAGSNSYHVVPITVPKEEAPPPPALPPEALDSDSGSDYEHYDFSAQPPVALTTFYNSQRHRVMEEEAQQSRFQMPPLEEGLEELHTPPMLAALPGPCTTDTTPRDPGRPQGGSSGSSTSSGEDYCNSPKSRPPPWSPQAFSLELAGPPMPLPGGGVPAGDSSSTSSGEWYQNFQSPPKHQPTEQFECPGRDPMMSGEAGMGPPDLRLTSGPAGHLSDSSYSDYDDIGAA